MTMTTGEVLSAGQAARLLGLSRERVVQLEKAGRLVAIHSPLGRLFPIAEVEALVASRAADRQKTAA